MIVLEEKPIEVVHPEKPEVAVMLAPLSTLELAASVGQLFNTDQKDALVRLADAESALKKIVVDWRGFERNGDAGPEPIPFSPDQVRILLHGPTADQLRYKGEMIDGKQGYLYFHNLILQTAVKPFSESPEGKA